MLISRPLITLQHIRHPGTLDLGLLISPQPANVWLLLLFFWWANTRWTGEVGPNINGYWWFSFTFFFSVSLFWSRSGKMGFNIGWTKSLSYDSSSCVSFDYWGYSGVHSRSSPWALANPLFQSITRPRGFRFWWEAISFCSRRPYHELFFFFNYTTAENHYSNWLGASLKFSKAANWYPRL